MVKTIVGMFSDTADARRAVYDLEEAGFPTDSVSVAMRDTAESAFKPETSLLDLPFGNQAQTSSEDRGQIRSEGLYPGKMADMGPVVAAGPLATGIGGAALGRSAGGLTGSLTNIGIPNETARTIITRVRTGEQTLVAIGVPPADAERVEGLFLENGAVEVFVSRAHKRAEGEGDLSIEQVQVGF